MDNADSFGQNFLPETMLESVPETNALSEAPMLRMGCSRLKSVSQLPYQQMYARETDFDVRPMSRRESESTNSSLETNFQLTDNFRLRVRLCCLCGLVWMGVCRMEAARYLASPLKCTCLPL